MPSALRCTWVPSALRCRCGAGAVKVRCWCSAGAGQVLGGGRGHDTQSSSMRSLYNRARGPQRSGSEHAAPPSPSEHEHRGDESKKGGEVQRLRNGPTLALSVASFFILGLVLSPSWRGQQHNLGDLEDRGATGHDRSGSEHTRGGVIDGVLGSMAEGVADRLAARKVGRAGSVASTVVGGEGDHGVQTGGAARATGYLRGQLAWSIQPPPPPPPPPPPLPPIFPPLSSAPELPKPTRVAVVYAYHEATVFEGICGRRELRASMPPPLPPPLLSPPTTTTTPPTPPPPTTTTTTTSLSSSNDNSLQQSQI